MYFSGSDGIDDTFQFTTSHGGRHGYQPAETEDTDLSIHDLTRRSTVRGHCLLSVVPPFNSRPHTEVDVKRHSPICHNLIFQFTTSHGGRRRMRH